MTQSRKVTRPSHDTVSRAQCKVLCIIAGIPGICLQQCLKSGNNQFGQLGTVTTAWHPVQLVNWQAMVSLPSTCRTVTVALSGSITPAVSPDNMIIKVSSSSRILSNIIGISTVGGGKSGAKSSVWLTEV
jgi:hypothetical protein